MGDFRIHVSAMVMALMRIRWSLAGCPWPSGTAYTAAKVGGLRVLGVGIRQGR